MQVLSGGNGNSYITVRFLSAGSYGIFVGGGCTTSLNVTVSDNPTVAISGPAVVCHGTMRTYSVPAGTACTWSVVSGSNLVQSTSGAGNINFNITWKSNVSGNAKISVTRTHTSGCQATGFYDITVEDGVGTISGPGTADGCAVSTYTSGSGSNRSWSVTGGSIVDPQGLNPMRISWNGNVTSGTVSVSYTSAAGCNKTKSLNVSLTPIIPTITPADPFPANEYCYKATRTFYTEPGWSTYNWSITGLRENPSNPNNPINHTYNVSKPVSDPNRNAITLDAPTVGFSLFGNVTISVNYNDGGTCTSATKQITMSVTPATIAFRGSATDVPIACYSDSQGIGAYSTDAGYSNYTWSAGTVTNVGTGTPTNPSGQTTNMDWVSAGNGIGGTVPITVTYRKSTLDCDNTNLARNGVNLRKPALNGANPQIVNVGQTLPYSSTDLTGYEYSWAITPPSSGPVFGRFTDAAGNTIAPPTDGSTYITWDRNNEPDGNPSVTVNYWLYYGGTRISYCTGASKVIDIRACNGCSSRKASDIAFNDEETSELGTFKAFPVPADNELWIHNVPVGAAIKMIAMNGTEAISATQDQENMIKKIETSNLGSGVYLLRTVDVDNQPVLLRVIIRH